MDESQIQNLFVQKSKSTMMLSWFNLGDGRLPEETFELIIDLSFFFAI